MPEYMQMEGIPNTNMEMMAEDFTRIIEISDTLGAGNLHVVALTDIVHLFGVEDAAWNDTRVNLLEVKPWGATGKAHGHVQDMQDLTRTKWVHMKHVIPLSSHTPEQTIVMTKLVNYMAILYPTTTDTQQVQVCVEERIVEKVRIDDEILFLEDLTNRWGGNMHYSVFIDMRRIPMQLGEAILYGKISSPCVDITEALVSQLHQTKNVCVTADNARALVDYVHAHGGLSIRVTSWELETLCAPAATIPSSTDVHSNLFCGICQDDTGNAPFVRLLPCNHAFHAVCAAQLLSSNYTTYMGSENGQPNQQDCPLCRADFSNVKVCYRHDLESELLSPEDTKEIEPCEASGVVGSKAKRRKFNKQVATISGPTSALSTELRIAMKAAEAAHGMVEYMLLEFKTGREEFLQETQKLLFDNDFVTEDKTVACFASSLCKCGVCSETGRARTAFVSDDTPPDAIIWLAARVRALHVLTLNNAITSAMMFDAIVVGPWKFFKEGTFAPILYFIVTIDAKQANDGRLPRDVDCVIGAVNKRGAAMQDSYQYTTIGSLVRPSVVEAASWYKVLPSQLS